MIGRLWIIAAVLSLGCEPASKAVPERPADPAYTAPVPGKFGQVQFAKLKWLAGDWRGTMPDGTPFFERYDLLNDTTIRMWSFADSTFSTVSDSSMLIWSDSLIVIMSDTPSAVAERIDSAGVHFAPLQPGRNKYSWRPTAGGWNATLYTADGPNAPTIVYEMRPAKAAR